MVEETRGGAEAGVLHGFYSGGGHLEKKGLSILAELPMRHTLIWCLVSMQTHPVQ